jgi:hypothetical protein
MCVIYKAGLGSLLMSMIILMTIGCRQQAAVPENNDFSYLEPEYTKKPISFKEDMLAANPIQILWGY